jgi:glycosyltransferase involved in cell wall biosynthesis
MEQTSLHEAIQQKIGEIKQADILVGIPSYNNALTIGHVVRAVQAGFGKYFPDRKCVLVNADGGSTDGTPDIVKNSAIEDLASILIAHKTEPFFKIATPYHGVPGKGSAFRTIFQIAHGLNAQACAVVDSDLRSITPEWIELLLKPILDANFDYVAPLYHRHKYDGTITNSIVYPLTRALYGKRVRQPIGGDFGFSRKLAQFYLTKNVWETDVARYGIDIWMTTTALANGFNVCQSFLGAKIHDPKDPGADLSAMLFQVLSTTFDLMETYHEVWASVKGSETVPTFGFVYDVGVEPVNVNLERMIGNFNLGLRELSPLWGGMLSKSLLTHLRRLGKTSREQFSLPDEVWAEVVYSFAVAAHKKTLSREHLLKSLTPLYLGRTASFVIETWESEAGDVEARIEKLCKRFEEDKQLLLNKWS